MKIQPRYYLGTSNGLSRNTSKESAVSIPQNVNQAKSLVELECRVPASHTNQLSESSQIVMSCALQLTDMDLFDEWTHAHKLRSDGASNTVGWFQLLRIWTAIEMSKIWSEMQRKAGRTGTVAAACGLRLTVDGVSGGAPPRHRHRSSRSSTGAHEGVQQ
ncbi:hypothetical protein FocTR4_00007080 [Fusarium oxysporum f. sp. cubense]|uniref:Uncharacterized protein n=1 Tax=Fusarium oxysporum f. sp. cubense TaxID=61366 RepID=A0A5C6TNP8_FUSOC|nr:hypothetical protein FocTR4_00007080 [Fusarium oxysporum f. sp. cubense]